MTLTNKRHPKESNCVPLSGIFSLKGKARVCRITPGTRGHVMPCYPGQHRAPVRAQPGHSTGPMSFPSTASQSCSARPVWGWVRGCGVAQNAGDNSCHQGGASERGRQCGLGSEDAAVSKAGETQESQKASRSHLQWVTLIRWPI